MKSNKINFKFFKNLNIKAAVEVRHLTFNAAVKLKLIIFNIEK